MSPYFGYVRILDTTTGMLPVHRSSSFPSEAGLTSRLSKLPSFLRSKPLVRWLALACIVIAVIWFGHLWSFGRSELFLHRYPWHSPNLNTNHLHRPSIVPPLPPTKEEQDVWEPRKNEVRNALKHAWSGYKSTAYPYDELLPVSGGRSNKFFVSLSHTFRSTDFIVLKAIMAGV